MLGYNRTITRRNINVLLNIGPGAGEGRKKEVKKGAFPTLLTMIVVFSRNINQWLRVDKAAIKGNAGQ